MTTKTGDDGRKAFFCLVLLSLAAACFLGTGEGFSQSLTPQGSEPVIRIGKVTFQTREIQAAPSSIKMLEIQIEIHNDSQKTALPANSVRVVVTPKDVTYSSAKPSNPFPTAAGEFTIPMDIPPQTGRSVIIGFSLTGDTPESITFEIQASPPSGPTKNETWGRL